VSVDAVTLLSGRGGTATFRLSIPDAPVLVGMHFFEQAMVLDPAAGNALGAVMSDAAEGVVADSHPAVTSAPVRGPEAACASCAHPVILDQVSFARSPDGESCRSAEHPSSSR